MWRVLWAIGALTAGVMFYLAASVVFPQLLLFPHVAQIGETPVYSVRSLTPEIQAVIQRADKRTRTSAVFDPVALRRPVFLTDGGWRWHVLSIGAPGAVGLTRPLNEAIVVNRFSLADDRAWSGETAGSRTLSGLVAHERTHVLIRKRFGFFADRRYPAWVVEGYCDYVGGDSALSDEEAERLRATGSEDARLRYYDALGLVKKALADNGGSVEDLFQSTASL